MQIEMKPGADRKRMQMADMKLHRSKYADFMYK